MPSVTIKVSIPVEIGGNTGQRDQWESHVYDMTVDIEDDERVVLESTGYSTRKIWFDLDDLKEAVDFINRRST
jgi:hypothetical protein